MDTNVDGDIQRLLAGFRAGEPGASAELYARFGPFIRAAVRRQLNPRLRNLFDSLDFVQDVWASFCAAPPERDGFETEQAVVRFLTGVAHNKVVDVARQRFGTQKYDIAREIPTGSDGERPDPPAATPTPSQWAIADEQWERLLSHLPPGHRAVVERLREGHNYADIARMTNVSLSTVNRIVGRLKEVSGL